MHATTRVEFRSLRATFDISRRAVWDFRVARRLVARSLINREDLSPDDQYSGARATGRVGLHRIADSRIPGTAFARRNCDPGLRARGRPAAAAGSAQRRAVLPARTGEILTGG